jgi:hypothetical protein
MRKAGVVARCVGSLCPAESTIVPNRVTRGCAALARFGYLLAAIAGKCRKIYYAVIAVMRLRVATPMLLRMARWLLNIGLVCSSARTHVSDSSIVGSIVARSLVIRKMLIHPTVLAPQMSFFTVHAVKRASVRFPIRSAKLAKIQYSTAPSPAEGYLTVGMSVRSSATRENALPVYGQFPLLAGVAAQLARASAIKGRMSFLSACVSVG